jgi:hypothetical protein
MKEFESAGDVMVKNLIIYGVIKGVLFALFKVLQSSGCNRLVDYIICRNDIQEGFIK